MAMEGKILRMVRVQDELTPGVLVPPITTVAEAGGSIGEMRSVTESSVTSCVRSGSMRTMPDRWRKSWRLWPEPRDRLLEVRDEVLELHQKGKIAIRSRYKIDSLETLRRVYTPGVAEVCLKIAKDPSLARLYTSTSHLVAIVTDGTAVLGLGDIGPLAGMPVMEGKAMLMETLVGLSGVPILLNSKDPDRIVDTVAAIAPTFAAIQLEDISAPRCFGIEVALQAMLDIPVMHDDQHGTAVVTTAALTVATRATGWISARRALDRSAWGRPGRQLRKCSCS